MRNKKYRPYKLWLLILICMIVGYFGYLIMDEWERYIVLVASGVLFVLFIYVLTYYLEVKEDRIIIRYSIESSNKKYHTIWGTITIMIEDISEIDILKDKTVIIRFKSGGFSLIQVGGGFLNCAEIIRLIYDVKKQIYSSTVER